MKMKTEVSVLLTTRDRYLTTLPLCLLSIVNQTYKPKRIVLVDDNNKKELYDYEIFKNILTIMKFNNIEFEYLYGESKGCTYALQLGLDTIEEGWILKIDDDNVLEPNVIELFVENISDNIGVMGGLILDEKSFDRYQESEEEIYNKIGEIYSKINIQMVANQDDKIKKVHHIYSNYFFKKDKDINFDLRLAPNSLREETVFTYEYFRKGYDLIVIPTSRTYHLNHDRTKGNSRHSKDSFLKNELVFLDKLKEWEIIPNEFDIKEEEDRFITSNSKFGDQDGFLIFEK